MIWLSVAAADAPTVSLHLSPLELWRFTSAMQVIFGERDSMTQQVTSLKTTTAPATQPVTTWLEATLMTSDACLAWGIGLYSLHQETPLDSVAELSQWLAGAGSDAVWNSLQDQAIQVDSSQSSALDNNRLQRLTLRKYWPGQQVVAASDQTSNRSPASCRLAHRLVRLREMAHPSGLEADVERLEIRLIAAANRSVKECQILQEQYDRWLISEKSNWSAEGLPWETVPIVVEEPGEFGVTDGAMLSEQVVIQLFEASQQTLTRLRELETDFDRAIQRAKMEAMKELAYGASHEVNNPLANISTRAQTLLRDESDPDKRQRLAMINRQAFRAHEMISNMMLFAHPPDLQNENVSLLRVIETVAEQMDGEAVEQKTVIFASIGNDNTNADRRQENGHALSSQPPGWQGFASQQVNLDDEAFQLIADRTHLEVLIQAMVRNALEAIGEGGEVELSVSTAMSHDGMAEEGDEGDILVDIVDTGPGIPESIQAKIFDPFFSGREAGRGLGFGLSKAWRIATLHGGSIDLLRSGSTGSCFRIVLPRTNEKRLDKSVTALS